MEGACRLQRRPCMVHACFGNIKSAKVDKKAKKAKVDESEPQLLWYVVAHPKGFSPELCRPRHALAESQLETGAPSTGPEVASRKGERHDWNVLDGIVAPEVLEWLLEDPDLKKRLEATKFTSTKSPDAECKKGFRYEFGLKVSFSGRLRSSETSSMNGTQLQPDFLGRTRAWNEAFLIRNECQIAEMVGEATAKVGELAHDQSHIFLFSE